MENWGTERWSKLPKVTQLVSSTAGIRMQVIWLPICALNAVWLRWLWARALVDVSGDPPCSLLRGALGTEEIGLFFALSSVYFLEKVLESLQSPNLGKVAWCLQENIKRVILVLEGRPDNLSELSGSSLFWHLGAQQSPWELPLAAVQIRQQSRSQKFIRHWHRACTVQGTRGMTHKRNRVIYGLQSRKVRSRVGKIKQRKEQIKMTRQYRWVTMW